MNKMYLKYFICIRPAHSKYVLDLLPYISGNATPTLDEMIEYVKEHTLPGIYDFSTAEIFIASEAELNGHVLASEYEGYLKSLPQEQIYDADSMIFRVK